MCTACTAHLRCRFHSVYQQFINFCYECDDYEHVNVLSIYYNCCYYSCGQWQLGKREENREDEAVGVGGEGGDGGGGAVAFPRANQTAYESLLHGGGGRGGMTLGSWKHEIDIFHLIVSPTHLNTPRSPPPPPPPHTHHYYHPASLHKCFSRRAVC